MIRFAAAMCFLAACAACPSTPQKIAPDPDEGTAVCVNLSRVGCAIGTSAQCSVVMGKAVSQNHTSLAAMQCAATAATKDAVVACDRHFFNCP